MSTLLSLYPGGLDNFTLPNLPVSGVYAVAWADVGAWQDPINQIEKVLGLNPNGGYTDVASRLTAIEGGALTGILGIAHGGTGASSFTTSNLIGSDSSSSTGALRAITIGTGLSLSGSTLSATGGAGTQSWDSTLTIGNTASHSCLVSVDNTYDLGATANSWANLFTNNAEFKKTVGIGGASLTNMALYIQNTNLSTSTSQFGIVDSPTFNQFCTGVGCTFNSSPSLVAGFTFTLSNLEHIIISDFLRGIGSTVTNQYGIYINSLANASNNYALFSAGTSSSMLGGSLSIGKTSAPTVALDVVGQAIFSGPVTATVIEATGNMIVITSTNIVDALYVQDNSSNVVFEVSTSTLPVPYVTLGPTYSSGTSGYIRINGYTTATAPGAGGGGALPATPLGYITININGTARQIPYY